jgi:hypothetical protein
MNCCDELSPGGRGPPNDSHRSIVDWWNAFSVCDRPGGSTWEVLDDIQRQVTECLSRDPPDIGQAESLTARAALLMAGLSES